MATNQQVVVINQQADPVSFGFIPVMILCGVFALIITYFWQVLFVSALILAASLLWRAMAMERRRAEALRTNADRQDRMYLAGDERGVFGEGFESR